MPFNPAQLPLQTLHSCKISQQHPLHVHTSLEAIFFCHFLFGRTIPLMRSPSPYCNHPSHIPATPLPHNGSRNFCHRTFRSATLCRCRFCSRIIWSRTFRLWIFPRETFRGANICSNLLPPTGIKFR